MRRKFKKITVAFLFAIVCTIFLAITMPEDIEYNSRGLVIQMNMRVQSDSKIQLYYLLNGQVEYSAEQCKDYSLKASDEFKTVYFKIPYNNIVGMRIDLGECPGYVDIKEVFYNNGFEKKVIDLDTINAFNKNQIDKIGLSGETLTVFSAQKDPYLYGNVDISYTMNKTNSRKLVYCLIAFLIIFVVVYKLMDFFARFVLIMYQARHQICNLAMNDFKSRYSGSYLGIAWGFLQSLSTILLFWFVFQVGFKSGPIDNAPFILWLLAGMIPWNFFSDAWLSGSRTYQDYSYLVEKVVFNIDILPMVRIAASSILNIIFHLLMIIIYTLYGRFPGWHILDMVYYTVALTILAYGLTLITATLNVFMKDVGQFLQIIIQFVMWMTPMMWTYTTLPDSMSWFYNFNPLHYIINGYRESLLNGHWFFYQYPQMVWYWSVTIVIVVLGDSLLQKTKVHFADVL